MCRSEAEGGQRCFTETLKTFKAATKTLDAMSTDAPEYHEALSRWEDAARDHASTPKGEDALLVRAAELDKAGDLAGSAQVHQLVNDGLTRRAANQATYEQHQRDRMQRLVALYPPLPVDGVEGRTPPDLAGIAWQGRKEFIDVDQHVPGVHNSGRPVVLAYDSDRDLQYTWYDRSPLNIDVAPRESGVETSALIVTRAGAPVGELRVSFSSPEVVDAACGGDPFLLAANDSHEMFSYANNPDCPPEKVWTMAWQYLRNKHSTYPASMKEAGHTGHPQESMAPTDPAAVAREVEVARRLIRKRALKRLKPLSVPFVAYSDLAVECPNGEPLRGTGVGSQMYLLAARRLATTGRKLRGSGNQSAPAQAMWARLQQSPDVPVTSTQVTSYGKTSRHLSLDFTKIEAARNP